MKLFYFDTETTGVKFWKNSIHQISGMIVIDNEIKETFDFHIQPHPQAIIEDEALKISGVTREQIKDYPSQKDTHANLVKILDKYVDKYDKTDKFFLVGYNNAGFDNPFLRALFKQVGDNYFGSWFWSSAIDVMVLAAAKLMNERATMINFKLMTVAKQLGIKLDESKLHDAFYDIKITREIHLKL